MIRVATRCRVIIDNDWAGDPDGLVALAHHALSPANRIVAVTSSLTNPMFGPTAGMAQRGSELAGSLLQALTLADLADVCSGPDTTFTGKRRGNPAAQAIVEAAATGGDLPLILVCAGPLTNVADALLLDPGLASALTLAWVGGAARNEEEYNYFTDPAAADFVQFGPLWCLGDSAPLAVTGLDGATSTFTETGTVPQRRTYTSVDSRLVVADLVARLRMLG
ncbi:inosine-uridine preferring nucleoside hydrolase [Arthrobacter sp. AG258]|uniref:nucleoside hydrolase n=1 Tax=Arthrobacter sp. AG258 TaxID=2183899 RepID=UPI0010DDD3F1|nr:nucleoside hydrolase [Arthrobacter sp. AG258]TDT81656.1 inosine-uridine preferring nucleoside hydrolase [Arthrobacter sp. AG258]